MVNVKGKPVVGAYYDLDIGYYSKLKDGSYFPDFKVVDFARDDDGIENFAILTPAPPEYKNSVFSKGNLR